MSDISVKRKHIEVLQRCEYAHQSPVKIYESTLSTVLIFRITINIKIAVKADGHYKAV